VVTAVSVNGANESDQHQVLPALEQTARTCGKPPEALHGDCGFGSGENIVAAKALGTELLTPIGAKPSDKGVTLADFELDASGERVLRCPVGQVPVSHQTTHKGKVHLAVFGIEQCAECPLRGQCPMQKRGSAHVLRFTAAEAAVARRRIEQETPEFKEAHMPRAPADARLTPSEMT
jgi:hypothetical protein